jgi:prephenate dehydrogenase
MEEIGWRVKAGNPEIDSEEKQNLTQIMAIRQQIDELDHSISRLLAQRLVVARQLTQAKNKLGWPVQDNGREAEVLKKVGASSTDAEIGQSVRIIYETIMAQSRLLQDQSQSSSTLESAVLPASALLTGKGAGKTPIYFPRVLIVGLGLIGGALASQIKRTVPQTVITGVDSPTVLSEALRQGVIDIADSDPVQALTKTQLIILSANPDQNLVLLEQIAPHLSRRQLIIDVTSTKTNICRMAERLNLRGADFIGGHPFFGNEKSGLEGSRELAVEGKTFCLVPTLKTSEISLRRLSRWLTALQFKVETTDATTHDIATAKMSHLVQLLAVTLGAEITDGLSQEELKQLLKLSGPSFAQTARLMSSPAKLWSEIVLQNSDAVSEALGSFTQRLKKLRTAVQTGDQKVIAELFERASAIPPNCP